ncbi:hypothetical protein PIIN_06277 [Serendipita indica DSM 11827]|uniref:Uncharacterized protein n=1 Tax=Serendipita indica (strain DSM 11827) TaxID=1109443 RepID=G4TM00_SERID|nr:hypothetical protein PIIN_06277 [Serendipita indica DSM 11827]
MQKLHSQKRANSIATSGKGKTETKIQGKARVQGVKCGRASQMGAGQADKINESEWQSSSSGLRTSEQTTVRPLAHTFTMLRDEGDWR